MDNCYVLIEYEMYSDLKERKIIGIFKELKLCESVKSDLYKSDKQNS